MQASQADPVNDTWSFREQQVSSTLIHIDAIDPVYRDARVHAQRPVWAQSLPGRPLARSQRSGRG